MTASPQTPVRILLVDDSELVRRGIKTVLAAQSDPPLEVVAEARTAAEAVAQARLHKPDIVLLDIRLPDDSGFVACRKIMKEQPGSRVIVLTSHANDNFVYEAVIAGVQGYLMKEVDPSALIQAIRDVATGQTILDPDATARVFRLLRTNGTTQTSTDLSNLSPQERRVLALVTEGRTNKEVGEQLSLSENTVKNYLANVFEKLNVKTRAQAAVAYTQQIKSNPE